MTFDLVSHIAIVRMCWLLLFWLLVSMSWLVHRFGVGREVVRPACRPCHLHWLASVPGRRVTSSSRLSNSRSSWRHSQLIRCASGTGCLSTRRARETDSRRTSGTSEHLFSL